MLLPKYIMLLLMYSGDMKKDHHTGVSLYT
jgi:hypothetical protein